MRPEISLLYPGTEEWVAECRCVIDNGCGAGVN